MALNWTVCLLCCSRSGCKGTKKGQNHESRIVNVDRECFAVDVPSSLCLLTFPILFTYLFICLFVYLFIYLLYITIYFNFDFFFHFDNRDYFPWRPSAIVNRFSVALNHELRRASRLPVSHSRFAFRWLDRSISRVSHDCSHSQTS